MERNLYNAYTKDNFVSKFISRILFKRPKTFQTTRDQFKFRTNIKDSYDGYRIKVGSGGSETYDYQYDKVGTDEGELLNDQLNDQLKLENTMSYDEMKLLLWYQ